MDAKSLGPIIREWRNEADQSQQELANLAGLTKKIVGSIERGERTAEKQEIVALCKALEKSPAELITLWSRSFLNELIRIQQGPKSPSPPEEIQASPESKVDLIIDKMAVLAKQLYRESKEDVRKMFFDWLTQSAASSSFPPPSPPKRPRKRVSRKRGSD